MPHIEASASKGTQVHRPGDREGTKAPPSSPVQEANKNRGGRVREGSDEPYPHGAGQELDPTNFVNIALESDQVSIFIIMISSSNTFQLIIYLNQDLLEYDEVKMQVERLLQHGVPLALMDNGQPVKESYVQDELFKILISDGKTGNAVHSLARSASHTALVFEQKELASLDTRDKGEDVNAMDGRAGEKVMVVDEYQKVHRCVNFLSSLH